MKFTLGCSSPSSQLERLYYAHYFWRCHCSHASDQVCGMTLCVFWLLPSCAQCHPKSETLSRSVWSHVVNPLGTPPLETRPAVSTRPRGNIEKQGGKGTEKAQLVQFLVVPKVKKQENDYFSNKKCRLWRLSHKKRNWLKARASGFPWLSSDFSLATSARVCVGIIAVCACAGLTGASQALPLHMAIDPTPPPHASSTTPHEHAANCPHTKQTHSHPWFAAQRVGGRLGHFYVSEIRYRARFKGLYVCSWCTE